MPVEHALQYVGEIGIGLDIVELGGFDEGANDRPAAAATIAAGKQVVLATECNGTDGPLDRVRVELDTTIGEEAGQSGPTRQRIASASVLRPEMCWSCASSQAWKAATKGVDRRSRAASLRAGGCPRTSASTA